ncbi:MAG: glycosyltransferase family protein [Planctomycetota bacterium]|jgi:hypothetical protein
MTTPHVGAENGLAAAAADATRADGRNALLALRQSGERYRFLDLGYRYLAAVDDDPQVTLEVLKALVELGLGGPARELLQQRRDLAEAGIDPAELQKSVASIPTGRVPWDELREQFEANLASLLQARSYLDDHLPQVRRSLEGFQLFRTTEGGLHLSRRDAGRLRRWIPGLTDTAQVAAMEIPLGAGGPVPAVVGIDLSPLIERVHRATSPAEDAAAVPLVVIDDQLYRLAAWLHVAERETLLRDERVHFFVGPRALQCYERFLEANEDIAIHEVQLSPGWASDLDGKVRDIGQRIVAARSRALVEVAAGHHERARQRTIGDWADRLRPGARILGFTSRFTTMLQYSMRDIGHALEALGYRFHLVIERAPHCRHTTLTTGRAVAEHDPALIVLINHFRCEQPQSLGAGPLLSWIQDPTDIVLSKRTGASIGPLDFVCGYYQRRCTTELGYPRARFFPAPLAVSAKIFHDGPIDPAEAGSDACDLLYVGHLHDTVEEHLARWRAIVPRDLHPLLERIRVEVTALHERGEHLEHPKARAFVDAVAAGMNRALEPVVAEQLANYFAFRLFDLLFRRQTLRWAARWAKRSGRVFRLYGRGWSRDPELGTYAVGPIDHGEPLRRAYRGARLTIQTIPGGFTHQRAFEALLSGSLVIGRHIPADFAERGAVRSFPLLDRVVFRDADGLGQLAHNLLANESVRRELQSAFADIIRREFTYEGVVRRLLAQVKDALVAETR